MRRAIDILALIDGDRIGRRHQRVGQAVAELDDDQQEGEHADAGGCKVMDREKLDQQMADRDDRRGEAGEAEAAEDGAQALGTAGSRLRLSHGGASRSATGHGDWW